MLVLATSATLFSQRPPHFDARLHQVLRVGVALRPVAQDGDLAAGDQGRVGVGFVVQRGHGVSSFSVCVVISSVCVDSVWAGRGHPQCRSSLGSAPRPVRWSSITVYCSSSPSKSSIFSGRPASTTVRRSPPTLTTSPPKTPTSCITCCRSVV